MELETETKSALVSVIMPIFNGEQHLRTSIGSVLEQTYENWELIVIDDGSTDHSAGVVAELAEKDPRIRYFYQDNAGQANARNAGIRRSRGRLIAFLDQDDLWMKEKLEVQVKILQDTHVDVVFSNGFLFKNDDYESTQETFPALAGRCSGAEMQRLLFLQNRIPVLSALLRKDLLDREGLLDEDPVLQNSDDYDLWMRLAAGGAQFLGLPDKLVRYRLHSDQASKDLVKSLSAELAVLKKHELTTPLAKREKDKRFYVLYEQLIMITTAQKRFGEARTLMKELTARRAFRMAVSLRSLTLRTMPNYYPRVIGLVNRGRESFSYRIGRYFKRNKSSVAY